MTSQISRKDAFGEWEALSAEADLALATGDWATAATAYEVLAERCPEQVELTYSLARAYQELGRLQDMIALLKGPSVAGSAKAKRMLANIHMRSKDYASARPLVEELIAAFPYDTTISKWKSICDAGWLADLLKRGDALFHAEQLHEAADLYRELLADYPEVARAYFRLGQIYTLQHRWADSVPLLRKGLDLDPRNDKMKRRLAQALAQTGEHGQAIALLATPGCSEGDLDEIRAVADLALSNCDWPSAAAGFEFLVGTRPEKVELKFRLARAYEELGRIPDAIELLNGPAMAGVGKAQRMLANNYMKSKNYTAARPLIDELIVDSPDDFTLRTWKSICDESRLAEQLQRGEAFLVAERYDEAEQLYRELLEEHSYIGSVYFRLGQIFALQRRWAEAIPPLRRGLALDPGNNKIRKRLAQALSKTGQPSEAIALLQTPERADDDLDVLFILQRCHMKLRDWAPAKELGDRLLAILPLDDARHEYISEMRQDALVESEAANVEAQSDDPDRAISLYTDIAERHAGCALAWFKLGTALARAARHDDAAVALGKASNLRPGDMRFRQALTRAVVKGADEQQILRHVRAAVADGVADVECHRWLARYHADAYDWPSARDSAQNALAVEPNDASTRLLLVRILMHLGRLPAALDELDVLTRQRAKPVETLQLKADIFIRMSQLDRAIDLYLKAMKQAPDHPMIGQRLSYAYLLKGDIAGFHRFHEKRRALRTFIANNKDYAFRNWNGELSIEGKLLVWSEYGLGVGQNILHMAFLRPLAALGFDVVFEVEPRLVDLCRRSFPEITVVSNDGELPSGISHHTPIGSLSRWFKPDLESFQTMRPFLLPDIDAVGSHRARLQQAAGEGQLLIGISWTSNNPFVGDVKSVQLDQLLGAIAVPGVRLVNLQYGEHSESIARAEAKTGNLLMDSGIDNSDDLDGLAAVIAAMDLVVCIGHTTAHMAGAVGTPNYLMLPAAPFPHWLDRGERCIWYPATTLFRQAPIDYGWGSVMERVSEAVRDFANIYDRSTWLSTSLMPGLQHCSIKVGAMSPQDISNAIEAFAAQGAYRSALELIDRLPPEHLSRELERRRGYLLDCLGDWDEARAVYASLRTDGEESREIDSEILSVSLSMYDLEHALPFARQLGHDDPAFRLIAANILYRLRRYEEALAELRLVSLETPEIEGVSNLLGSLLLEMREFERAEAYLSHQAAMRQRAEEYTLLGRSISAQGRREEALTVYDKAVALSKNDAAANFWRTQERVELGLAECVPLSQLHGEVPDASPDDLVIFVAADNAYFWRHALVLLGSLGRRSPRANCHVHVINPDDYVAKAVEIIRKRLPDLRLSYSYEHVDLEGRSKHHVRTYYASVRFVRLAEVFAKTPASYLCLDVDCIVRNDIAAMAPGANVGLRMRYDERPHLGVAAGAMMLRPTEEATHFIERVSSLIRPVLEAGEAVWFLDQIVLSQVMRELGGGPGGISQIGMTYIDWFFHDNSVIWTGKGKRKSEDNRFTDEVSQYRYIHDDDEISDLIRQSVGETPAL
jgi:tetratricopeptide (TPR) repeat protein